MSLVGLVPEQKHHSSNPLITFIGLCEIPSLDYSQWQLKKRCKILFCFLSWKWPVSVPKILILKTQDWWELGVLSLPYFSFQISRRRMQENELSLVITRLALASILGPFWNSLYSPHFCIHFSSLSHSWAHNPVHWCTIWGSYYWNLRWNLWCVTHTTHEYDCYLFTGFRFALVFTCTFTECVT